MSSQAAQQQQQRPENDTHSDVSSPSKHNDTIDSCCISKDIENNIHRDNVIENVTTDVDVEENLDEPSQICVFTREELILSNLRIVCDLKKDDKIGVDSDERTIFIDPPGYIPFTRSIKRYCYDHNRSKTIEIIYRIVQDSIDILDQHQQYHHNNNTTTRRRRDHSNLKHLSLLDLNDNAEHKKKVHHHQHTIVSPITQTEEVISDKMAENIKTHLNMSILGLRNLKKTYCDSDCSMIRSKIDTIIDKISMSKHYEENTISYAHMIHKNFED